MQKFIFSIAVAALLVPSVSYAGGNAAKGKAKSAMCAGCHGATGTSPVEMYPNLAGQKATYISKQLKAFKDGVRKDPSMNAMVAGLSPEDMLNLGAFYAAQK
jgi:cytochrome c553